MKAVLSWPFPSGGAAGGSEVSETVDRIEEVLKLHVKCVKVIETVAVEYKSRVEFLKNLMSYCCLVLVEKRR